MPIVPLFGAGFKGRSSNVTAQRYINMYAEAPPGAQRDKGNFVLYPRPGLSPQLFTGSAIGGGPLRGFITVQFVANPGTVYQTALTYIFSGQGQYALVSSNNPDRFLTSGPDTPVFRTNSGQIVYADNGLQVIGVDGVSAYIAYYSVGNVSQTDMQSVPVANFPYGARTICYLAGHFIVDDQRYPGRFVWSAVQDGFTWDPVDFATAETVPDPLIGVYAWRGELVLFGARSIEWWAPTTDTAVFARTTGAVGTWGCYKYSTIQPLDETLCFVGSRTGSEAEVVLMEGYTLRAISTPDVEYDLNIAVRNNSDMSALVLRSSGHTWYILNLPSKTWVYDASTGGWSEWQTDGGRFAGQYATTAYLRTTVSDYRDGRIWQFTPTAYVDGPNAITRQLELRHLFHDLDRFAFGELMVDMETGIGLSSGQGSDPKLMLQISRDGGHTFGNEMVEAIGALGNYATNIVFRRLGLARDFTIRLKTTDAIKAVFINVAVRVL